MPPSPTLEIAVRYPDHWSRAGLESTVAHGSGTVRAVPRRERFGTRIEEILVLSHVLPESADGAVTLTVRSRPGGAGKPEDGPIFIRQRFLLRPAADGASKRFEPVGELHPLLDGAWAAAAKVSVLVLGAHLDFVDVTERMTAPGAESREDSAALQAGIDPPAGGRLRFYEWVAGGPPHLWIVASPAAAIAAKHRRQFIVLFTPKNETREGASDVRDMDLRVARRYLLAPPKAFPWFIHARKPGGPWSWNGGPNADLLGQLRRSKKAVHVVLPYPVGEHYGRLPALWPHALRALSRTVAAHHSLVPRARQKAVDRCAIAGASLGGGRALAAFLARPEDVDELILFDPSLPDGHSREAVQDGVVSWLTGDRRAHFFGGTYRIALMRTIARRVPGAARVRPERDDYWTTSVEYNRALAYPAGGGPGPDLARDGDSPSPDSLSARLGVWLAPAKDDADRARERAGELRVVVYATSEGSHGVRLGELPFKGSARELAAILELAQRAYVAEDHRKTTGTPVDAVPAHVVDAGTFPVGTLGEAKATLSHAQELVGKIRHKWSLLGGEPDPERPETFRGNLQLALDEGGF